MKKIIILPAGDSFHLYQISTVDMLTPNDWLGKWTVYESLSLSKFTDLDQCWGSRFIILASTDKSLGLPEIPKNEIREFLYKNNYHFNFIFTK